VKASPDAQLKLLELAETDAELSRLDHRRRSLPETAEYERAEKRDAELADELATLDARAADIAGELRKSERDVDQVRARIERDQVRLDAGHVSSPRELEDLQSEIASLHRRQADLEEVVLEVMERQEELIGRQRLLAGERAELSGKREDVGNRRDAALAEITAQADEVSRRRSSIADGLPGDLLALYDRLRAQHTVGAAALRRGRCEGCHLSLGTVDLARIRAAAPDEVLRCEECRRILVRTPESGL
jgi:predicted  nucleic acid-binding Zn-ribbon protein